MPRVNCFVYAYFQNATVENILQIFISFCWTFCNTFENECDQTVSQLGFNCWICKNFAIFMEMWSLSICRRMCAEFIEKWRILRKKFEKFANKLYTLCTNFKLIRVDLSISYVNLIVKWFSMRKWLPIGTAATAVVVHAPRRWVINQAYTWSHIPTLIFVDMI